MFHVSFVRSIVVGRWWEVDGGHIQACNHQAAVQNDGLRLKGRPKKSGLVTEHVHGAYRRTVWPPCDRCIKPATFFLRHDDVGKPPRQLPMSLVPTSPKSLVLSIGG